MRAKYNLENKQVYVLLDQTTPKTEYYYNGYCFEHEPFYVGIGNKNRYKDHFRYAIKSIKSTHKLNKIRKIQSNGVDPLVCVLVQNINIETAMFLEVDVIATIGRANEKCGPLTNISPGWDDFVCRGEDHYLVKNSKLGIPHPHKGRKDISEKRFANKGYNYLCYYADGTPRKKEKYKEGDDWKSALGKKNPLYFNKIPWLNPGASKSSKLAWFLKDEIVNLSFNVKITGDRTFSKLCNKKLNVKETYNLNLNRNTPKYIVDFVNSNKWTENLQKIWQEWKNIYSPN